MELVPIDAIPLLPLHDSLRAAPFCVVKAGAAVEVPVAIDIAAYALL